MKFFKRSNSLLLSEKNKLLTPAIKALNKDDISNKFGVSFFFIVLDLTVIQKYELDNAVSRGDLRYFTYSKFRMNDYLITGDLRFLLKRCPFL